MFILTLLIVHLFSVNVPAKKSTQSIYKHKAVIEINTLFKKYIFGEFIAYERLIKNEADQKSIKAALQVFSAENPDDMTKDEQKAFWINVYNLSVIDQVLTLYPIKSVKDEDDFFTKKTTRVYGKSYSFDDIEKHKLKAMNDPRVHFALVCASLSCPNIEKNLYEPNRINFQLEDVTQRFILNERRNRISQTQSQLSMLFKWYEADFGGKTGVLKFINQYVPYKQTLNSETKIVYLEYDWRLNGEITGREQRN
jgi:hypothetical protein